MPAPTFFQAADLLAYHNRLQSNPYYDSNNDAEKPFVTQLVEGIFDKTQYWVQQDKAFYFTLGVDSGHTEDAQSLVAAGLVPAGPALILKLDGHFASDGTLTQAQYAAGEALRQELPLTTRWQRIGPEQLGEYSWAKLLTETVAFIGQHEDDLRRIMAATRR